MGAGTSRSTWIVGTAVVVVAVLLSLYLFTRVSRTRACDRWHRAVAELTTGAAGSVGTGTAAQFRLEAIRRGWIDTGRTKVFRPSGCTP